MSEVEPVSLDKESIAKILQEFIDTPDSKVRFAWGKKLANEEFLESMSVDGFGEVKIPIFLEDVVKLKEASIQTSGLPCHPVLSNAVRDGWQVDKSKVKALSPSTFFENTLPNFANRSLVHLGLDAEALGMNVHFQNLLIYEPGGPFHRKCTLRKEPGTFAKLVLHVPVEVTAKGGQMRVNYNGDEKYFYFDADCDKQFYCTIFFTDCQHELEDVTEGWKVLMVFNLAWKKSLNILPPLNQLPAFLKAISKLKEIISKWECKDLVYFPRLLAIPLVNCYEKPISFSVLKEKDRWMANIFKCIDFVDVFLVLPSTMMTSRPVPDSLDYEEPRNNLGYQISDDESDENFIPLSRSSVEPSRWIDSANRPVCFGEVDIHTTELVGNFQDSLPPVVDDNESFLTDPMMDQMWDQPVLVIWPKKQSVVIACQKEFNAFLDLLERQVGSVSFDQPVLIATLDHVLDYCLKRPINVWYHQDEVAHRPTTRRLLELCISLKAVDEGLKLFKILGNEFRAEISLETGDVQTVWFYEGIRNEHVASAAAAFIELAGWEKCKELVRRLIESRVNQIHSFCYLSKYLLDRKCMEAAISVFQETFQLLLSDTDLKAEWRKTALCSTIDLILILDGSSQISETNRISDFFSNVCQLDAHLIAVVIVHIGRNHSHNLRSATKCRQLYLDLCRAFLNKSVDTASVPLSSVVADLATCFIWLEDDQMIQDFFFKMATSTNSSSHNLQLHKILFSTEIINQLMASESGQKAFRFLIDARINELDCLEKPIFTWSQPSACLAPEYSEVEEFLHSPMHSAIFDNFDDADKITEMVMNYFSSGSVQNGYSAEATIGYGDAGPYCNISKTTALYEAQLLQYRALTKELQYLTKLRWRKWRRNFQDGNVPEPQPEDEEMADSSHSDHFDWNMEVNSPSQRRIRVVRRSSSNQSISNVRSMYRHIV